MNLHKNKFYFSYFILLISLAIFISSCGSTKKVSSFSEKENNSSSTKIKTKYAELLNVKENKIDNIKLYTFINDWYGVKYKYGGKTKKGIDCSAFTSELYNNVYNKPLNGTAASIFYQCKPVSKNNLDEGDLVFFKIDNDNVTHIGVYLQNNKFVHASTKKGVMIDDLDEPYYKKYFYKGGRIKN